MTATPAKYYKTLFASSFDVLDILVTQYLSQNWELYGSPYVREDRICQVVVWTRATNATIQQSISGERAA